MMKLLLLASLVVASGAQLEVNVRADCDIDGCFDRCESKYGSSWKDQGSEGYYCSKGCAHVTGGQIDDANFFCKVPENKRFDYCSDYCGKSEVSKKPEKQAMCGYGCGFWKVSPPGPSPTPPAPTPPGPSPTPPGPSPGGLEVDVEDFGAKADNKTLSSSAINAAIKHVSENGGGTVHCRASGSYLIGRIEIQSHVELRISKSTTLQASDNKEHWTPYTRKAPPHCEGSGKTSGTRGGVFRAQDAEHFSITGGGSIDGGGLKWNNDDERAHFLEFYQCSDVIVEDLTIRNSAAWTLNPKYSQRLTFRRLRIEGDPKGPNHHNTDGFDPFACKDVQFLDSYYAAGDDCIAVKSGTNEQGRECGIASENILVRNITCIASHGLTIGSEMSGGIRNVTFSNIRIGNPKSSSGPAVRIKSQCGRGAYIRDVLYEDITAEDVESAVWVDMQYGSGSPPDHCSADLTSIFSNIKVRNLHAKKITKTAFEIVGLKMDGMPDTMVPIDLTLENVVVEDYKKLGTCTHANVTVRGVTPALPASDKSCHIKDETPSQGQLIV